MGGIVSGIGDALSGAVNTVGNALGSVASNPVPAITAAVTGNPTSLLAYALPSGSVSNSGLLSTAAGALQGSSNTAANQQAAQLTSFRPVGITNTFGTSGFSYDPTTGQMTGAGYQLSPQLQEIQNAIMGNMRTGLGDIGTLQKLGRGYLAQTPEQAAADWMTKQQAVLQPGREQQLSNIRNKLFQTGRTGLSVAQGGNLAASNPEMQAYYNALAQQDAQLAAQAQQAGQQQVTFGQGLLSSAYQPLNAGLTAAGTVEGLGVQPLELSSSLGGRTAYAGQIAAPYLKAATSYNPTASILGSASTNQLLGNLGNLLGSSQWTAPATTFSGWGNDYSGLLGNDLAAQIGLI